MTRILIIDDYAVVRAGVRHFLHAMPQMDVTGEAATAEEAFRLLASQEFDVVLLDISMPDKSGIEILAQIRREKPHLPVLILSMHPESRYAVQMLRNGASGYIQKDALSTELIEAIQTALRGQKYISPAVAELLTMEPLKEEKKLSHEMLSEREYDVFIRLSKGQAITNIAEDLFLSVKTISTYRTRVLQKLNMSSNADLIYYAIKQNLID